MGSGQAMRRPPYPGRVLSGRPTGRGRAVRNGRKSGVPTRRWPTWVMPHTSLPPPMVDMTLTLPRLPWTISATREAATLILNKSQVDDQARHAIQLALSEVCTNAVRHAAPADTYQVRLRIAGDCCLVEVSDTGRGFDPPDTTVLPEPTATSGRGLAILYLVTDQIRIRRRYPTGMLVSFVKRLTCDERRRSRVQ